MSEKQLIPEALPAQRSASNVDSFDYDKRTVTFALTSETPVSRWYGDEILDHSDKSIDNTRLKRGIPLLFNHNPNQQIGRIESYEIRDKKLYVTARFGNSALAQEKLNDVRDGILVDASGGYIPRDYQLTKGQKGGADTVRWTNWMPAEGSLCAVPADPTVGIGRSGEVAPGTPLYPVRSLGGETNETAEEQPQVETPAVVETRSAESLQQNPATAETKEEVRSMSTTETGHNEAVAAERQRVSEISAIAQRYSKFVSAEQRDKFVNENASVETVRKHVMDAQIADAQANEVRNLNPLGLTEREQNEYSLTRAIMQSCGEAKEGFETEVSRALAKLNGREARANGIFVPANMRMRAGDLDRVANRQGRELITRANDTSSSNGNGAATIFTDFVSLIDLLRNQVKVRQMGATFLAGLTGNIAFPKQTGATTAYWVADNPGSDVTDSNITFAQMSMTPKILQASTGFSRLLLQQSSIDVEALIRMDLTAVVARAIDKAALEGSGTSNQPKGIKNQTGIGSVATTGAALTFDNIVELETQVAEANADVLGTAGYLTTPRVRKKLKLTPELANTIALPIWQNGEVNGYRADVTNQFSLPSSGGGSPYNQHSIIYGVWSELLIGEWVAYEVVTDPFRLKKQGVIEVTTYDTCDVNVRHAQAFAAITDINPNA